MGNNLGVASQRALQEGRQTHPAELTGLWQALWERAGRQQKQPELALAGIAGYAETQPRTGWEQLPETQKKAMG